MRMFDRQEITGLAKVLPAHGRRPALQFESAVLRDDELDDSTRAIAAMAVQHWLP